MPIGFMRIAVIRNDDGKVVDYMPLEANPAVGKITNCNFDEILNVQGSNVGVSIDLNQIDLMGDVIRNGEAISGTRFDETSQKFYNYTLYSTEPDEITILFQNTTESVLASEALRRGEQTMRNIFKNIPVGIEIYDKDGYLVDINELEQELFGFTDKNEIIGLNIFENPMLPQSELEKLKGGGGTVRSDIRL